jgi:hypothetical protein
MQMLLTYFFRFDYDCRVVKIDNLSAEVVCHPITTKQRGGTNALFIRAWGVS